MRRGRGGGINDFKFGTFIGRFKSDGAASVAVKGLNVVHLWGKRQRGRGKGGLSNG